jgi:S-phase kinase-associated protein 1
MATFAENNAMEQGQIEDNVTETTEQLPIQCELEDHVRIVLQVQSNEDENVLVPIETTFGVIKICNIVPSHLEDATDNDISYDIPLPQITETEMRIVLEFCDHYAEEPMILNTKTDEASPIDWPKRLKDVVQQFYAKWVYELAYEIRAPGDDVEAPVGGIPFVEQTLFRLCELSIYLECKYIHLLTCARVGCLMQNHTPEEITALFNIEEEFNEEETANLLNTNKWSTEPTSIKNSKREPTNVLIEVCGHLPLWAQRRDAVNALNPDSDDDEDSDEEDEEYDEDDEDDDEGNGEEKENNEEEKIDEDAMILETSSAAVEASSAAAVEAGTQGGEGEEDDI